MATLEEIRELKRRHSARLLGLPGVSGVGIERDDDGGGYALAIHLDGDAANQLGLPAELEGHRIKYIRSGPFRKLPTQE
jgi:hypothetical protein